MVKLILSFEKKHLGFLLLGIGIFVFAGFVWAYDPTFVDGVGVPAAFGHSADELMVSVGGNQKTLQEAINDGSLGAPSGDPGVDLWLAGQSGAIYYNGGNVGIGTSTPGEKFHVFGNALVEEAGDPHYAGLDLLSSGTGLRRYSLRVTDAGMSPASSFVIRDVSAGVDRFSISPSGGVSIGTLLWMNNGLVRLESVSDDAIFNLGDDSGADYIFRQAGSDVLTIDGDSGKIIYSPSAFDIQGSNGALILGAAFGNTCTSVCSEHGLGCNIGFSTTSLVNNNCGDTVGYRLCFCD